jgi:catechol 2,3-dioxygenase-like lactoylglutathione lyase family enzyme
MAFNLKHLHLKTKDPQKAAKWWVSNTGAKMINDGTNGSSIQIELAGLTMNVSTFIEGITFPQSYGFEHLSVGAPNNEIDKIVKKMTTAGARILQDKSNPTTGQKVIFVETPDGTKLEIVGEV